MTKNSAEKKATRAIMAHFGIHYTKALRINRGEECAFGGCKLTELPDGTFTEEVGEFWSDKLQNSVLAHPDCTPNGIDAIINGTDPDWKMA